MITIDRFRDNYNRIIDSIKERCNLRGLDFEKIKIIIVTKSISDDFFLELVNNGFSTIGENRPQQIRDRKKIIEQKLFPDASKPEWHMIGTLQSNKIKYLLPFIKMIHSVNNLKLLQEINKQCEKNSVVADCLIEINTAEDSKTGGSEKDCREMMKSAAENPEILKNVKLCGLMTMAPNTNDEKIINESFSSLSKLKFKLNNEYKSKLEFLSMGMSADYLFAIDHGATHLRIGSAFFV